jgi:putative flippase GtrA
VVLARLPIGPFYFDEDRTDMLAFLASGRALVTRFDRMLRYFGVGIINSVVGYALYALFVALIKNIYVAQISAHILGMTFNYIMLKTHVFRGATPVISRYIAAYAINYFLGLGCLFIFHQLVKSPYLAGLLSLILVAIINYFVLRAFVFRTPAS